MSPRVKKGTFGMVIVLSAIALVVVICLMVIKRPSSSYEVPTSATIGAEVEKTQSSSSTDETSKTDEESESSASEKDSPYNKTSSKSDKDEDEETDVEEAKNKKTGDTYIIYNYYVVDKNGETVYTYSGSGDLPEEAQQASNNGTPYVVYQYYTIDQDGNKVYQGGTTEKATSETIEKITGGSTSGSTSYEKRPSNYNPFPDLID